MVTGSVSMATVNLASLTTSAADAAETKKIRKSIPRPIVSCFSWLLLPDSSVLLSVLNREPGPRVVKHLRNIDQQKRGVLLHSEHIRVADVPEGTVS